MNPSGTYQPVGATSPIADPGGTYSAAGATAPTTDPAGTYSSPYALDRLFFVSSDNTPATSALSFTNETDVANYYGIASTEYAEAKTFFANGAYDGIAKAIFARVSIFQRPHLIGANLNKMPLSALQAVNGSLAISLNGYAYSGQVNLAGVASLTDAALAIRNSLHTSVALSTLSDCYITPETVTFDGQINGAQLTVDSVTAGESIPIGAQIHGAGITDTNAYSQIIIDRGANGGPGSYDTFSLAGFTPEEPMTATYGVLHIGSLLSGDFEIGQRLEGPGIAPLTSIISGSADTWLINNAQTIPTETMRTTAPLLTVDLHHVTGRTNNHQYLMIQPSGAFGFNYLPSKLSYASGTAADALGLTQASGAVDSTPGGQTPTLAQLMNQSLKYTDQYGNPVHFGSYQSEEPRLDTGLSLWSQPGHSGLGYEFLPNHLTTLPAGSNLPVTDPLGTWSPAGASAPILNG